MIIYKYQVPFRGPGTIELPVGAKPRFVAVIQNTGYLWAEVDPAVDETKIHKAYALMTGEAKHDLARSTYLGTLIYGKGEFITHVYMDL